MSPTSRLPGSLPVCYSKLTRPARAALFAVLVLAAGLPYAGSLSSEFVLDDWAAVVHNQGAHSPLDLELIFGRNYWGNPEGYEKLTIYRPLATLTFALTDVVADGDLPACHRVINILIHILATLLVFGVGLELFRGRWPAAAAAALLFGVHPVHSEAVIGVVNRAELMAALFVLLGSLVWLRLRAGSVVRARLWVPVIFALALLSKENGFTLWGVVLGWEVLLWLQRRWKAGRWENPGTDFWLHLAMGAVFGAYMLLRSQVLYGVLAGDLSFADNPMVGGDWVTRVLTPFKVFFWYSRLLLLPGDLTIDYSLNHFTAVHSLADPEALAGLLLCCGMVSAIFLVVRGRIWFSLSLTAFFATYSVVSNMAFLSTIIMAERLVYLPSAYWLLPLTGAAALAIESRQRLFWPAVAVLVVVTAWFAVATVQRSADWRTALELYRSAVEAAPQSAKAQHLLALELSEDGEDAAARKHFAAAVAIDPSYHVALTNYARCLARLQQYDQALPLLKRALELHPGYDPAVRVVCGIYERTGQPAGARKVCFPSSER